MKTILVVDNDKLIREYLTDLLSREGYRVLNAADGLAALDVIKERQPDAVILDLIMPFIDGRRLLWLIRALPGDLQPSVVVLSAALLEDPCPLDPGLADACIAKGPFQEMGPEVLATLKSLRRSTDSREPIPTRIAPHVRPRLITKELLETKRHFEKILDQMSEGIVEMLENGRIIRANPAAMRLLGRGEEELLGACIGDFINGTLGERLHCILGKPDNPGATGEETETLPMAERYVSARALSLNGDRKTNVLILRDMTRQTRILQELKESEARFRTIVDQNADAMFIVDQKGIIRFLNPAAERMMGASRDALMGTPFGFPVGSEAAKEIRIERGNGEHVVAEMRVAEIEQEGEPMYLASLRDITELVRLRDQLESRSLTDDLTNLYNRRAFLHMAEQQLKTAARTRQGVFLMFMDMDNLKTINDGFGHRYGDQALRDLARVLKEAFRESDVIARIGGDEFAVVASGMSSGGGTLLCDRLQERLKAFNRSGERSYTVAVSFGVAYFDPLHPTPLDSLMEQADRLMYANKVQKKSEAD